MICERTGRETQAEPNPGIEAVMLELRELVNDNDPSVHAEALVALGNLAGNGAPPAELNHCEDPDAGRP